MPLPPGSCLQRENDEGIPSSNKVQAKALPWDSTLLSSLDCKHLEDRGSHDSVLARADVMLLEDSDQQPH